MALRTCVIGIDVGLTAAKAAAFDLAGHEVRTVTAPNPRVAVSRERQEIDMLSLWEVVAGVLRDLCRELNRDGWQIAGIAATGHGNGLYLVDEQLAPVRAAIASTDNRAEGIIGALDTVEVERVRLLSGSLPWAAQPAVLLKWLEVNASHELDRARWALTCKDWITACLTGVTSADYSDASGCGLVNLATHEYEPAVFDLVHLSRKHLRLLPPLRRSDEVVGKVTVSAAEATGLPAGTPVVAGCMDCVASTLGAGATAIGDVTVIVGTWAINSVVVSVHEIPPRVTINSLLPDPDLMLAMEVAPTSAAGIEWAAKLLGATATSGITPRDLLEAGQDSPPLAEGLIFLPFVHGSPELPGASGALIGIKANHEYSHVARAVAEGITQYHRVQMEHVRASGATISEEPWTLAGGGAKNPVWAQMFADITGHRMRRQLETEIGARGVASLVATAVAGVPARAWNSESDPKLVVSPGPSRDAYIVQAQTFDRVITAMAAVWEVDQ